MSGRSLGRRVAGTLPLFLLLLAPPAWPGAEEFSTFSIYAQQEDDESLFDHLLLRPTRAWRDEWERSANALRTSQGCLTSGQWMTDTQLRLRTPLGERARFGLDVRDQESDRSTVQYFDFSFRFPTAYGTPGFQFRPFYDKSRQDLALFWEAGAETSAAVARVTFTFEDTFNNLWAFRQSRVGQASEPYERHPYEPAVWFRFARPALRVEAGGQWLTPSRTRFVTVPVTAERHTTLWGALGQASLEARVGAVGLELSGAEIQALSREAPAGATLYGGDFRRQWSVESAARSALGRAAEIEARWIYRESTERSDPPFAARRLGVVDRALQLEARTAPGRWGARVGALYDRISVDLVGDYLPAYRTRRESRAYLGLAARFGAVSLDVVEGFELDHEPYDVWGVHDKAFAHLQTTF